MQITMNRHCSERVCLTEVELSHYYGKRQNVRTRLCSILSSNMQFREIQSAQPTRKTMALLAP